MTIRSDATQKRRSEAAARFPAHAENAVLLTATELDHVTGAGSKPGVSPGIGIGKPASSE